VKIGRFREGDWVGRSSTRVGNRDGKRAESVGVTLSICIR